MNTFYKIGYCVYCLYGRLQCILFMKKVTVYTVYDVDYSVYCL